MAVKLETLMHAQAVASVWDAVGLCGTAGGSQPTNVTSLAPVPLAVLIVTEFAAGATFSYRSLQVSKSPAGCCERGHKFERVRCNYHCICSGKSAGQRAHPED